MHEDLSQLFVAIWTAAALLALSAFYPAYKLAKSARSSARISLKVVALLTVAAPLTLLAFDRLRSVPSSNDARALQAMPVPVSALPALYVISVCAAAVILWLLLALHSRYEA